MAQYAGSKQSQYGNSRGNALGKMRQEDTSSHSHAKQPQSNDLDPNKEGNIRSCTYQAKNGTKLLVMVHPHYALKYQNDEMEWDQKLIMQSKFIILGDSKEANEASKEIWQSVCDVTKKDEAYQFIVKHGKINLTEEERKKIHANDNRKAQRLNDK